MAGGRGQRGCTLVGAVEFRVEDDGVAVGSEGAAHMDQPVISPSGHLVGVHLGPSARVQRDSRQMLADRVGPDVNRPHPFRQGPRDGRFAGPG